MKNTVRKITKKMLKITTALAITGTAMADVKLCTLI